MIQNNRSRSNIFVNGNNNLSTFKNSLSKKYFGCSTDRKSYGMAYTYRPTAINHTKVHTVNQRRPKATRGFDLVHLEHLPV